MLDDKGQMRFRLITSGLVSFACAALLVASPGFATDDPAAPVQYQAATVPPIPMAGGNYDLRDRLDILNLLGAYGQLFDLGHREAWLNTIFAEDAVWTLSPTESSGVAPVVMRGRDGIRQWFAKTDRPASATPPGDARARIRGVHHVHSIAVLEQTPTRARIIAYETVGGTGSMGQADAATGQTPQGFRYLINARIEGVLGKDPDGRWRIRIWNVFMDGCARVPGCPGGPAQH